MRFLRERIRLTQKAKGDAKKNTESTAQSITSAPSTNDANRILEQIKTNTNESSRPPKTDISRRLNDAEQADTVRRALNGILQRQNHQSLTSRRRCEMHLKA